MVDGSHGGHSGDPGCAARRGDDISTRDELIEFILQWENDSTWATDILDDYATEVVRQVADKLESDYHNGQEFGVHESDGLYAAVEYLRGIVYGYGVPQRAIGTSTP
jgi:hypothetical protein